MADRTRQADGAASTELVLLMPTILTMVLLIVQFGVWLHARQVVTAAAQEGLAAAQTYAGSQTSGSRRAEMFLADTGGVDAAHVTATRDVAVARVEVRGVAPAVVPGLELRVAAVAQGPVERFVAEPDR